MRALVTLQAALAEFAVAERAVFVEGCADFARRSAALAPASRTLREHLALWIDSLDAAHARANQTQTYVHAHAAAVNAGVALLAAVGAAGDGVLKLANLVPRSEFDRLEARVGELERMLSGGDEPGPNAAAMPRAPVRKPKRMTTRRKRKRARR